MVKQETIIRYTAIWNKLQVSNVKLSDLDKISFTEFKLRTNIKTESQFRLAKSFARNTERQEQVNKYLNIKGVPTTVIKKVKVSEHIPKAISLKYQPIKIGTKITPKVRKPKSEYGIAKLQDDKGNNYWIKYRNLKDFKRQLGILENNYKIKRISYRGFRPYTEFKTKQISDYFAEKGVKL